MKRVKDVRDYGAQGDGFSDDTAAFKAACSAAGGGTVYVPAGVYKVSSFTVPDGISMAGEGMNTSIVAGTFLYSSNDVFTDLQIGADGVSLRSLKDANNNNVHDTQFKSCRFVGGPAAISFVDRRASNITFIDCVFEPSAGESISYDSNSLINGQPCSGYSTVQGCLIKGAGTDSANRWPHGLEFNCR
jgi:hypothetical protein